MLKKILVIRTEDAFDFDSTFTSDAQANDAARAASESIRRKVFLLYSRGMLLCNYAPKSLR